MSDVYNNWERLVEAIFKREELRRLALCSSSSSCSSDDRSSFSGVTDFPILDLTSGHNPLEHLFGVGKRGIAASAARLFTAPVILRTLFFRMKSELHHVADEVRRYSFRELVIATDNFNNGNLIGRCGFFNAYKGRLADGSLVAVLRYRRESTHSGELHFQAEVLIASKVSHCNLARLQGFCATAKERMLVYPLMVHGSVASHLRERSEAQPPLDWATRKRVALGSAKGLEYLHYRCNPKVLHRNIKAANIFLDVDFEVVLGSFGLTKLMDRDDTDVSTAVCGTIGHTAPEYLSTGQVSEKNDVFGYGVMLLELLTGQKAFDVARLANDDEVLLLDWVKRHLKENKLETIIDTNLKGNYIVAEVEELIQLALRCTQTSPVERPTMSEVVTMLQDDGEVGGVAK